MSIVLQKTPFQVYFSTGVREERNGNERRKAHQIKGGFALYFTVSSLLFAIFPFPPLTFEINFLFFSPVSFLSLLPPNLILTQRSWHRGARKLG